MDWSVNAKCGILGLDAQLKFSSSPITFSQTVAAHPRSQLRGIAFKNKPGNILQNPGSKGFGESLWNEVTA